MKFWIQILILLISLQHFGFMILEMFLWTKPVGRKVFRTDEAFARASKALAANQGLYNGFLAAGLMWSLFAALTDRDQIQIFFLICIVVAGLYGGATVNKRILVVQAVPAILALSGLFLFRF
ncbi:MAG: DUF1304 domain-containing protein [Bdellovibrionaceae bacterium]|nr:DUF1304 domain-containing protein [Pseudobdellovibrionaceae bacterium]